MKLAAVAFYGLAAGLLAVGLRELLTGFEENRCSMTYMFEYPEYRRVALPRRVARLYPAYGLYLYGEGVYAQETRALKLTGAPVLFLPGNAGSYKQGKSAKLIMVQCLHLNYHERLLSRRFLHESIKAILRLYKTPPQSVVLVGHSMGGVVARIIITQASPHLAPVLALDPYLLGKSWSNLLSSTRMSQFVRRGGYRDYQVRSGLTSCRSPGPDKLSLVYDLLLKSFNSAVFLWCKELVLATVRAFFDLIDPETRQFTENSEKKLAVLNHHFIKHPVRLPGETQETPVSISDLPDAWSEVNTLRLAYSTPKEGQPKFFLFALSSRRKAYSHFYCRSNNLVSYYLFVFAADLSKGTELLPPYKSLSHQLGRSQTNKPPFFKELVKVVCLSALQFTVECEWQREESQTLSVAVPHVLSFGLTSSDVTVNSSGLLHTIELQHFHQVYQAFRINVASQCKVQKGECVLLDQEAHVLMLLPSVYRIKVPWFREDSLTTVSVPSVTEISGMLHTSRPDNTSGALLQLHTAPNCQYKVSIRTSLPRVLGQILRFCGHMVPVYTAVTLLLACGGQVSSILKSRRAADMSQMVGKGLQPHKVNLPVYILHIALSCSCFQEVWSMLFLPSMDTLPPTFLDVAFHEEETPGEEWVHLLSPLLYIFGAAVAYWGSALLRLVIRLISLVLAPLHRPSVSRDCGTLRLRTQLLITLCLTVMGGTSCGALSIFASFLFHLYRVNIDLIKLFIILLKQRHPLLSECALQEVRDDLQLHLCLSALFTLPVMLSGPSLIHWIRNLRYVFHPAESDPCWPYIVPLIFVYMLLINCNTLKLSNR
uniref:GPI inositol-deacylase n=1 Tax=Maylandia zebra TaxID=106582 RepID=A0A3P9C958_9CICH